MPEVTKSEKLTYLKSKGYDIYEEHVIIGGDMTYSVDEIDAESGLTSGTLTDANTEADEIIYSILHPKQDQAYTNQTHEQMRHVDDFIKRIDELYASEQL